MIGKGVFVHLWPRYFGSAVQQKNNFYNNDEHKKAPSNAPKKWWSSKTKQYQGVLFDFIEITWLGKVSLCTFDPGILGQRCKKKKNFHNNDEHKN